MTSRYVFTLGKWHEANSTAHMWLKSPCMGHIPAGFYIVLLGDYPMGTTLLTAMQTVARMQGFEAGVQGELCKKCFPSRNAERCPG